MLKGAETIQKWGQGEETIKIYYTYRAVLATNKTIISDPDRKFHREAALDTKILAFHFIKRVVIKTERDFLPRSAVTRQIWF